jgi:hypothetical protein
VTQATLADVLQLGILLGAKIHCGALAQVPNVHQTWAQGGYGVARALAGIHHHGFGANPGHVARQNVQQHRPLCHAQSGQGAANPRVRKIKLPTVEVWLGVAPHAHRAGAAHQPAQGQGQGQKNQRQCCQSGVHQAKLAVNARLVQADRALQGAVVCHPGVHGWCPCLNQ